MAKNKVQAPPAHTEHEVSSPDFARRAAYFPAAALSTIDYACGLFQLNPHLAAAAAEVYKAPDIPLDQADAAIASFAARCAIVKALHTTDGIDDIEKVITTAIRDQFRSRSPLAIPSSWQRLALIAKKETERLLRELGHLPTDVELKDAVLSNALGEMISYNTKHPRRDPDYNPSVTEDTYRAAMARLRKTGLLAALDHLSEITALRVTYRPRTLEARRYLGDIQQNWPRHPADYITNFTAVSDRFAFNAAKSAPTPLGLHSQRIFGPLVNNTCTCGKYKNWDTQIECDRCHVTTGPASLRDNTCSYIEVPQALHADFVLATIPVIPPTQRPCFQIRNTWEFSDFDRFYTRMLSICSALTSAGPVGAILAPEATQLMRDCIADLGGPEGTNSF